MNVYILTSVTGRTYRRISRGEALVYSTCLPDAYTIRHISNMTRPLKMSDLLKPVNPVKQGSLHHGK